MKRTILLVLAALSALTSFACAAVVDEVGKTDPPPHADDSHYTDLSADWYRGAAIEFGYPEIFSEGTLFLPEKPITRMEYVRLLHKALDIEINYFAATDIKDHFDDVGNEDAGAYSLYDLVTAGIIDSGGNFEPNASLPREVMIRYAVRALDYVTNGDYIMPMMMPTPFSDESQAGTDYIKEINKAAILKLIYGRGNNLLFPKDTATRAEAVVLTDRLVRLCGTLMSDITIRASATVENGSLIMGLAIENTGANEVTIDHTSGQKFDFKVFDESGNILYTWSADKNFIQILTATTIPAGSKVEFTATIEKDAYGLFQSKASIVKAFIVGSSDDFYIDREGYTAKIT